MKPVDASGHTRKTMARAKRRVLLVEDDYFIVSDMARSFEAGEPRWWGRRQWSPAR